MAKRPPLPPGLTHLNEPSAPLLLSSIDAALLFEFWGFSRSGRTFLAKLERCAVLTPVMLKHQRGKRWKTQQVLEQWQGEQCAKGD
jgi:hypothetical protein